MWPAFYTRRTAYLVDYRLDTPNSVASVLGSKWSVGIEGGVVICAPVPQEYAMDEEVMESAISKALIEVGERGITGKDITPFLLDRIAGITEGDSLQTNIQLVLNNAAIAAGIAAAGSIK